MKINIKNSIKLILFVFILITIYLSILAGIETAKESYVETRIEYINKYCIKCGDAVKGNF